MGYGGKLEDKLKAQELRRKGLSYREILVSVHVSKDTLSRWCREIILTPQQLDCLYKKRRSAGLRGSIIGAKSQQDRRTAITKILLQEGIREVSVLSKRDRFIAGVALYMGEGTKVDSHCAFANADPKVIRFMAGWFREFCQISEERLRGAIWIHDSLDEKGAKLFWSSVTNIPITQFYKTYFVPTKNNKWRKNLHNYGIFSIRFTDSSVHRKIMGWISGILQN